MAKDLQAPNSWVGVAEAALYFGCCSDTIRRMADEMSLLGEAGIRRLGQGRRKINLLAMDQYLHQRDRAAVLARTPVYESGDDADNTVAETPDKIVKTW